MEEAIITMLPKESFLFEYSPSHLFFFLFLTKFTAILHFIFKCIHCLYVYMLCSNLPSKCKPRGVSNPIDLVQLLVSTA